MNVLDDKGNILSAVKLKEATLNVTLARQTLIELIQSYVNPQCIYTDHDVIKVENVEQHTMVHFSNHASQSFDLCIGSDGLHSVVRTSYSSECEDTLSRVYVFSWLSG